MFNTTDLQRDVENILDDGPEVTIPGASVAGAILEEAFPGFSESPRVEKTPMQQVREYEQNQKLDPDAEERARYNDQFFGFLATNKTFEGCTMAVIVFNAMIIGHDADYSARWGKPEGLYDRPSQFIILENFFCFYFTVEIGVRFLGYKVRFPFGTDVPWRMTPWRDNWFVFDSILVTFMVLETWILPIAGASSSLSQFSVLRLLRLLRITRMAKLMRSVPELMTIVKGLAAAVRGVGSAALLLFLVTYTFAIIFTTEYHQGNLTDDEAGEVAHLAKFGSMGKSFFALLVHGAIYDDLTDCTDSIRDSGQLTMFVPFFVYMLICGFTVMNMLVGILAEVVQSKSDEQREEQKVSILSESIKTIFGQMDVDNNGQITRKEFMSMKDDENVMKALGDLEIKETAFEKFALLLFKKDPDDPPDKVPSIEYDDLMAMILKLRPGISVSALEFASFRHSMKDNCSTLKGRSKRVERLCLALLGDPTVPRESILGRSTTPGTIKAVANAARPSPDTAGGRLQGSPLPSTPGGGKRVIDIQSLARLDRMASQDIVLELQHRLGVKVGTAFVGADGVEPHTAFAYCPPGVPAAHVN